MIQFLIQFMHGIYYSLLNFNLHCLCTWLWFSGGRTIIFTKTKESASQLAGLLHGARALHGDIQQAQREVSYK